MKDYTGPTPVFRFGDQDIWVKRDDHYCINGIRGGKVRACWALADRTNKPAGLITAGARKSPQMQIVARIAQRLEIPCRLHTTTGEWTPEIQDAAAHAPNGPEAIVQHKPGHNSVIVARAREDAEQKQGWVHIPFGMESAEAMSYTRAEVQTIAKYRDRVKRIVICLGSGMSAAGLLWGLVDVRWPVPVLGVQIGASPDHRLRRYAPSQLLYDQLKIEVSKYSYATAVTARLPDGTLLDPIYEAKCWEYVRPGDLFWVVGIRAGLEDKCL
jgi:1-aminocyclopropane-1-carboxylate deaminase/D-cysteine desulfhydrase-like pyridoxal-dependent ACC family enzyme